ncbi:S-methyl-5'-thioadenosine phosphorylase [Novosphingobium profundi]|uniref:S-methyl-5'-thioadenosine phosphorylase n=1 Tax=Novosphingobium profundi TaxID=1774954 RepID=UPI001BDB2362|nr:S-methyl-5'-thioadenosine phosphorylase [Novosphingobium profundi]MBT0666857.1 S-methyl-5'-thioadenosine phosphorylase [Novosphingobium profundi]
MRAEKSTFWHIGVIGGSGLAAGLALEDAQEIEVASPFGAPSGPVTTGRIGDVRLTFLARHGKGHAIPPSEVNYRANIDVLKRCGVTDVISLSAIGSLCEEMAPGHMVLVDQFIDRTTRRENSFFGAGLVAHVSLADPTCERLRAMLGEAASLAGGHVHGSGTYVCIEGPQFSTRAESWMYQGWGAQVIGMTAMPEARLAREAELPYAMLGMVTDYDCWREDEAGVEVSHVLKVMQRNADVARWSVRELARHLPARREPVPIDTALEHALMTAHEQRDTRRVRMLDAVACRLFGERD